MRFMMIVKASKESEAGVMPSEKNLGDMAKYNEELVKAGVMLAGAGLKPSSKGARIKYSGEKRTVTDGPFAERRRWSPALDYSGESKDEAIEWASACHSPMARSSFARFSSSKTSRPGGCD